ncbi:uncharacterized protein EKO05_0011438 [Ascochyta rabiei]|uniref:uncharacterized protein n=1 Tax=Didymella rabiei TaxID=5454 RepID=UPI00220130DC|nr:uncharacterized protein EKO05_0011438 [Ascochyta rabiei]UPX21245.1 hypothetical protein EKO05_0011438 [Ascochyta rabiei]
MDLGFLRTCEEFHIRSRNIPANSKLAKKLLLCGQTKKRRLCGQQQSALGIHGSVLSCKATLAPILICGIQVGV